MPHNIIVNAYEHLSKYIITDVLFLLKNLISPKTSINKEL